MSNPQYDGEISDKEMLGCLDGTTGEEFAALVLKGQDRLAFEVLRQHYQGVSLARAGRFASEMSTLGQPSSSRADRSLDDLRFHVPAGFRSRVGDLVRDGCPWLAQLHLLHENRDDMTRTEAHTLMDWLRIELNPGPIDLVEIGAQDVRFRDRGRNSVPEGEVCIFRYRDIVWTDMAYLDEYEDRIVVGYGAGRYSLDQIDQIWRMIPRQ